MNPYLAELLDRYPPLNVCEGEIQAAFELLTRCYDGDRIVYLCGNGGSAADAQHIVGELMKSFSVRRALPTVVRERLDDAYLAEHLEDSLRAVALTGSGSLATAFANDVASDLVFAQQTLGYGRPGDVLWGLSTSGTSRNVLYALKAARARSMHTLGMTGRDGGEMSVLCDVCIRVPECETHKVQELHLPVYHTLCRMLEKRYFAPQ